MKGGFEMALYEQTSDRISVEDRLPEADLYVLVICGGIHDIRYHDLVGGWFDGKGNIDRDGGVTHWQPLPRGPE